MSQLWNKKSTEEKSQEVSHNYEIKSYDIRSQLWDKKHDTLSNNYDKIGLWDNF